MAVEATTQIEQTAVDVYNLNNSNQTRLNLLQQGIAVCNELLAQNPNDVTAYLKRGEFYHKLRQYSLAFSDFSRVLELEPEPAAYTGRASVYNTLHQPQAALAEVEQALNLNFNYAQAYIERGKAYKQLRYYAAALEDYNQAIALNPKIAEAYTQRGDVWIQFNRLDKAVADYKKAIALDPNDADPYTSMGAVAIRQKKFGQAIADCQKAIALDPTSASAYNNRGVVYLQRKEYNRALTYLDYAAWLDPANATIHLNRGTAFLRLKQYPIAFSFFNYAINLDPNYPMAYNARGIGFTRLFQYQQAAADFEYAAQLSAQFDPTPSKIVPRFAKVTLLAWPLLLITLVAYLITTFWIWANQSQLTDTLQPVITATHGLINVNLVTGCVQLMLVIGLLVGVCNLRWHEIGWRTENIGVAIAVTLGLWLIAQLGYAGIDFFYTGHIVFNPVVGSIDLLNLLGQWLGYLVTYGLVLQTMLFGFLLPQLYFKVQVDRPLNIVTFVTTFIYLWLVSFFNVVSNNFGSSYLLWFLILFTIFNLYLNFNNLFLSILAATLLTLPISLFAGYGFDWWPPVLFLAASLAWPPLYQQRNGQVYVD